MVRVCHVITSLETGGAQTMLARLLESEQARGVEADVVSLTPGGGSRPRVADTGTPVMDLGMKRRVPDPRVLRRLAQHLRARQPGVVQTWLYHADLIGTLAARWASVGPVAWNLRCSYGHAERRLSARTAPHACAKLSRMPAVVVTNSTAGRLSHEAIGYRPARWELIPNGFDLERLAPLPSARPEVLEELGLPVDALLVGMVARPHPVKDHALVARVTGALAAEFPNLRLILVGEGLAPGDAKLNELSALAAGSDGCGAGRVVGLGRRTDVARLMSAFDVLVSASTHEGFPNVLGEALACGTPAVATDAGDSRDVVGPAGRVVATGDEDAFRVALRDVLALSSDERAGLGDLGRAHMESNYAIDDVVRRYVSLWEELAG